MAKVLEGWVDLESVLLTDFWVAERVHFLQYSVILTHCKLGRYFVSETRFFMNCHFFIQSFLFVQFQLLKSGPK